MPPLIFRKGLDLKDAVAGQLAESYHSSLVARVKEDGYRFAAGRLTVHLAREFGFCYGVDRAVDYAYQARTGFPDRTVFLTGEDSPLAFKSGPNGLETLLLQFSRQES